MPGRHKQVSGAAAEPPLTRPHARVASSTLRQLWDPAHGVPDLATKAALVEQINAAFEQAGLSRVYTERKLSDAVSNRMYNARRKMRERASMARTQPMSCGMGGVGGVVAAASGSCTTQARVGGATPAVGCCTVSHCPAESVCRHYDKWVNADDDSAQFNYEALPGDEFFAELDIDQLPTPPSSPPTSPFVPWSMLHDGRCEPPQPATPAWAPSSLTQQPAQPVPMGGSCMDVEVGDLSDLPAFDRCTGMSSSFDWTEKGLDRSQPCFPMDECDAAGQCASAA